MLFAGYREEFLGQETLDMHSIGTAELWTDRVKRVSKEPLADC